VQRNLCSGDRSPVPFSLTDITALLPCEESEFSYGLTPNARAALQGSRAAIDHPELVNCPSRSLFASLIQAHNLWGRVARGAYGGPNTSAPAGPSLRDDEGKYDRMSTELKEWEAGLPRAHQWSQWFLRNYKTDNLDLAYISIFMAIRLSNIVLRRTHFEDIKSAMLAFGPPTIFWETMSNELFTNMLSLHEGINACLPQRSLEEGFPPILPFCVYNCGSLALSLWKHPQLCPRIAAQAKSILHKSLSVLAELRTAWPVAARWFKALDNAAAQMSTTSTNSPKSSQDVAPSSVVG
jgi:hypothetical protein